MHKQQKTGIITQLSEGDEKYGVLLFTLIHNTRTCGYSITSEGRKIEADKNKQTNKEKQQQQTKHVKLTKTSLSG